MTVEIPLTKGYVAIVDDEDADLAAFKWESFISRNLVYAQARIPNADGKATQQLMHRIILSRKLCRPLLSTEDTDHIHGSTLDNRRSELRVATKSENARNRKVRSDNKFGLKGVTRKKGVNGWIALIWVKRNAIYLGIYASPEDAAIAYNHAAHKHYGEFASYNNIPDWQLKIPKRVSIRGKKARTGLKGVYREKDKWRAYIHVDGKRIGLGSFELQLQAHIAHCIAALKQHGDKAQFGEDSPFTKEQFYEAFQVLEQDKRHS